MDAFIHQILLLEVTGAFTGEKEVLAIVSFPSWEILCDLGELRKIFALVS